MDQARLDQYISQIAYGTNRITQILSHPSIRGYSEALVNNHIISLHDIRTDIGIVRDAGVSITRVGIENRMNPGTTMAALQSPQLPPQQVSKGVDAFEALDLMTLKFRKMTQTSRDMICNMLSTLNQDIINERLTNMRLPGTRY